MARVRKWLALYIHKSRPLTLGRKPPAIVRWQRIETVNSYHQLLEVAFFGTETARVGVLTQIRERI